MKSRKIAYACFAYVGALALVSMIVEALPLSNTTYQGLGMIVGIPAVVLALVASILGMSLTFFRWREWPLLVMSAAVLGFLAVFILGESLPGEVYRNHRTELKLASGGLMTIIILLSGRWYIFDFRKRER